jgi:hypothetical protein|tara:strand:- start:1254 stop:1577 length:324 start_codon:yes stop_codon:yes gene_type:complete
MTDENCCPKMYSNLEAVEGAELIILKEESEQRMTFEISHVGYETTHGILRNPVRVRMLYAVLKIADYPTGGNELTFKLSGANLRWLMYIIRQADVSMQKLITTGGEE